MEYDKKIDEWILNLLNEANSSMYYTEIYEKLCKSYRKISADTFDFHIKRLLANNLITKPDDTGERGKRVYFCMTDKAKQQLRLKVLELKSEQKRIELESETEEQKRLKLYLILFLFQKGYSYYLETQTEFQDFLLELHLSEKDFRLLHERELYRGGKKVYVKTFVSGPLHHNILFQIEKKIPEEQQVNQVQDQNVSHKYRVVLPGFTRSEISEGSSKQAFWHLNFTPAEVQEAIDLAFEEGLLKVTFKFRNEWRYEISDESLQWFLAGCGRSHIKVDEAMRHIWKFVRKPSEEEHKWLEFFQGRKLADEILREAYRHRHSLNKDQQKEKRAYIKKLKKELSEDFKSLIEDNEETIKKYQFPVERVLEVIWPKFLRDST